MEKKKHVNIWLYFLFLVAVFIIFDACATTLIRIFGRAVIFGNYTKEIVAETIYFIIILMIVLIFKNQYVFSEKKKMGFLRGILLAIPMLILMAMNFSLKNFQGVGTLNVIALAIYSFMIGMAEEFMCRGWIQNEMIEKHGETRGQIILSIILSSLIFGVMHIYNIFAGQGLIQTLSQILQALGSGFLLGAVYYRSKNIWVGVFLHGLWDFIVLSKSMMLLKECTFLNPNFNGSLFSLIVSIPISMLFIATALILLRKSKVEPDFGVELSKEEKKKDRNNCWKVVFVAIVIIFVSLRVASPFTKDYEKSQICYDYSERELENYTLTRSYKKAYEIDYDRYAFDADGEEQLEDSFLFTFELKDKKLTLTNDMIEESITFKYDVIDYRVLKSDDSYLIGILTQEDEGSVLYYNDFISEESMSNLPLFLTTIENTFKRYVIPDSTHLLGLEMETGDVFMAASIDKGFIFVDDDEVYAVVQQKNS